MKESWMHITKWKRAPQVVQWVKNLPPMQETQVRSLGQEGHGNSLQHSCLENSMVRGAWWATLHRVSKSRAWLKRLSKWKKPMWKDYPLHEYSYMNSRKAKLWRQKRSVVARGGWGGRNEQAEHTGIVGPWSCSVWYYNGGHMLIYICPSS